MRKRSDDMKTSIDHKAVTAAIDLGIWHDEFEVGNSRQQMNSTQFNMMSMESSVISATANFGVNMPPKIDDRDSKYLLISSIYESNYTIFLDLDYLK